jgi:hypothetical protein
MKTTRDLSLVMRMFKPKKEKLSIKFLGKDHIASLSSGAAPQMKTARDPSSVMRMIKPVVSRQKRRKCQSTFREGQMSPQGRKARNNPRQTARSGPAGSRSLAGGTFLGKNSIQKKASTFVERWLAHWGARAEEPLC